MGQNGSKSDTGAAPGTSERDIRKQRRSLAKSERRESTRKHLSFYQIRDSFETIEDVQNTLQKEGLESSNLVVGIDFTKSNEWSGAVSFNNQCLHHIAPNQLNPYEIVIQTVAKTLSKFDEDNMIPAYGFGDSMTQDRTLLSFQPDNQPCNGLEQVQEQYRQIAQQVQLYGPTSFGPLIEQAMKIVLESGMQYHILVIVADGQITRPQHLRKGEYSQQERDTIEAIIAASQLPLSIIMVGVGDGPWNKMEEFDDQLPQRNFDNFQFVNFTSLYQDYKRHKNYARLEKDFALRALMEIPEQYKIIKSLGLENNKDIRIPFKFNLPPVNPSAVVQSSQDQQKYPNLLAPGTNKPQTGSSFNQVDGRPLYNV